MMVSILIKTIQRQFLFHYSARSEYFSRPAPQQLDCRPVELASYQFLLRNFIVFFDCVRFCFVAIVYQFSVFCDCFVIVIFCYISLLASQIVRSNVKLEHLRCQSCDVNFEVRDSFFHSIWRTEVDHVIY